VKANHKSVVVQFAVAAVYDRRNLLIQKTAVIDRRYSKAKLNHCPQINSRPIQGILNNPSSSHIVGRVKPEAENSGL